MVAKKLNVDQVFKEGLGDYQAKPKHDLEKKMAAMIGIGGAAATSTAAAASTSSAVGTTTGATIGTASVVTKGGVIAKLTAVAKVVSLKSVAVLKTLGIVKTIGTIAVIGTATTATLIIAEDIQEDKTILQQDDSKSKTEMISGLSTQSIQEIELDEKTKLLDSRGINNNISDLLDEEESTELMSIPEQSDEVLDIKPKTSLASSDNSSKTSSNIPTTQKVLEKSMSKYPPEIIKEYSLDIINSIPIEMLNFNKEAPNLQKDSLKLQTTVPQPKSMSSLEKGLYLPNYNITANLYAMPFTALQFYKNEFSNDSITSHQIAYHPQWSIQLGADIRIQKKRKPWFLQLGINYMNLKQEKELRFNQEYIDHGRSYWNIDTLHYDIYINPPNIDTILEIDSAYMEHWIRNNKAQNSAENYHFISIPLQVGYEYKNYGKNWSLEAAAGISTSILLQGKGITYNSSGEIMNFSSGQLTPKLQFFAIGQLAFNYQLNKFTLFIKPTFKYQLSKINYDQSIEKNQFLFFGTQLGVRFKLFTNAGQP